MKKCFLLMSLVLILFSCIQHGKNTTSIRTKNQIHSIKVYKNISNISNTYLDSLMHYATTLKQLAKNESKFYQAMAAHVKGVYYLNSSSYELAKKQFDKTIKMFIII